MADLDISELNDSVTVRQAYLAMYEYLRRHYERGPLDVVGGLLGDLSLLQDGSSADRAALHEFVAAMDVVVRADREGGYSEAELRLEQ